MDGSDSLINETTRSRNNRSCLLDQKKYTSFENKFGSFDALSKLTFRLFVGVALGNSIVTKNPFQFVGVEAGHRGVGTGTKARLGAVTE